MAESTISDLTAQDATPVSGLPAAIEIYDNSLFVFEYNNKAYKVTGAQLKSYAIAAAQSVNKGADGITPRVGANGNWWLGDLDTGVHAEAEDGTDGVGIASITQTVVATGDGGENVITFRLTNNQSFDIRIKNGSQGPSGSGTGDMVARTYDPQGKRQDIFKYVDDAVSGASGGGELLVTAFLVWRDGSYQIDTPSHSFAGIKMAALANKTVRLKLDYSKMGVSTIELLSFVALGSGTTIYFGSACGINKNVSGVSVTSNDVWSYENTTFVTEEV